MEGIFDDKILSPIVSAIFNSNKFKKLCKTICKLRNIYVAKGLKHDQVTEKITNHIFNSQNSVNINWLNLKKTSEYYKIKNLAGLDSKTIELALAIHEELSRIMKKNRNSATSGLSTRPYSVDDMLDSVQKKLDNTIKLDKNTSSSSSENVSDLDLNLKSTENTPFIEPTLYQSNLAYDLTPKNHKLPKELTKKLIKRKGSKMTETEATKKTKLNPQNQFDSDDSSNSMNSLKSNKSYSYNQEIKLHVKDSYVGDCQMLKNGMIVNPISIIDRSNELTNSEKRIKRLRDKDSYLQLNSELKRLKFP